MQRDQAPGTDLQLELRDLLSLAVVGDHLRWVVVDDGGELRNWLDAAVPHWRALADGVAERLVALGIPPDGRVRALAPDISLNWVPEGWLSAEEAKRLLGHRLQAVEGRARQRQSLTADPDSAGVLAAVSEGLVRPG